MPKLLYRSRSNRMLGGVAGGLAEYSGIDPTVIRLILAALTVFTGFFPLLFFYLIAWAIMPEEPSA